MAKYSINLPYPTIPIPLTANTQAVPHICATHIAHVPMEAERVPMINGAAAPPAKPVLVVVAASFVMAFHTSQKARYAKEGFVFTGTNLCFLRGKIASAD